MLSYNCFLQRSGPEGLDGVHVELGGVSSGKFSDGSWVENALPSVSTP